MPEFNNIKYTLTDGEKFALICGMLSGLKMQDRTQPPTQVTVTLEPIGVNGKGTIGLMASDIEYKGVNSIKIPVVTHDVDHQYSGFSLSVSYPSDRIVINSISRGDFGDLQATSINNGKAYTRCMLEQGHYRKEPCIMCWLNCTIISPPTRGNPIEIKFNNSNGYDPNYCTLLTWVLNETDNNYYSYFITPTVNTGCKITSTEEAEQNKETNNTSTNLGDEQELAAKASPSLVALGTAYIEPGKESLIPIYTNCNIEHNLAYDTFNVIASIPAEWLDVLEVVNIEGDGEWNVTSDISYDTNDNLILNITGSRIEAKVDSCTTGYIRFKLDEEVEEIRCLIENTYSELTGPGGSLGVVQGDGYLYYPRKLSSSGGGSSSWGSGDTTGGMIGSGTIWSSSEQVIWIDNGGGIRYPIQLLPGDNHVEIRLPTITNKDTWTETTPTIVAPGYILIPGGFEWETIIKPDAPLGLSSPHITERFEIKDVYSVDIETAPIKIDVDSIIEEILAEDFAGLDIKTINILIKDFIENFEMNDEMLVEVVNMLKRDEDFIDNIELQDFADVYIESKTPEPEEPEEKPDIIEPTEIDKYKDEINIEDKVETTLINLDIIDTPSEESFDVDDVYSQDILKVSIKTHSQTEEVQITDFCDID